MSHILTKNLVNHKSIWTVGILRRSDFGQFLLSVRIFAQKTIGSPLMQKSKVNLMCMHQSTWINKCLWTYGDHENFNRPPPFQCNWVVAIRSWLGDILWCVTDQPQFLLSWPQHCLLRNYKFHSNLHNLLLQSPLHLISTDVGTWLNSLTTLTLDLHRFHEHHWNVQLTEGPTRL